MYNRKSTLIGRAEAVKIMGEPLISRLDGENCDFTNRLMDNGEVEFSASLKGMASDTGNEVACVVYYYQNKDDVDVQEDLSNLIWEATGYEII